LAAVAEAGAQMDMILRLELVEVVVV